MNKKFYGTLLLGTLLLGSTIVSCKDYDDDIDNLQNQITQLATKADMQSEVSKLQSAVATAQAAAENKAAAAEQAAKDAAAKAQAAADAAAKAQGSADAAATVEALEKVAADAAAAAKAAEEAKVAAEAKAEELASQLAELQALAATLVSTEDFEAAKKELNDKYAELAAKIGETTGTTGMTGLQVLPNPKTGTININVGYGVWDGVHAGAQTAEWNGPKKDEVAKLTKGDYISAFGAKEILIAVNPTDVDVTNTEFAAVNQFGEIAPIAFGTPEVLTRANAAGTYKVKIASAALTSDVVKEFGKNFEKGKDGANATLVAGKIASTITKDFVAVTKTDNSSVSAFSATVKYDEISGSVEVVAAEPEKVYDSYITGLKNDVSKHDSLVWDLKYDGMTLTYNAEAAKKFAVAGKTFTVKVKQINLNGYIHNTEATVTFQAKEVATDKVEVEGNVTVRPHTVKLTMTHPKTGDSIQSETITKAQILAALNIQAGSEAAIHFDHIDTNWSAKAGKAFYYTDDNDVKVLKEVGTAHSLKDANNHFASVQLVFANDYDEDNFKYDGIGDFLTNGKTLYIPVVLTGTDNKDVGDPTVYTYTVNLPVKFQMPDTKDLFSWNDVAKTFTAGGVAQTQWSIENLDDNNVNTTRVVAYKALAPNYTLVANTTNVNSITPAVTVELDYQNMQSYKKIKAELDKKEIGNGLALTLPATRPSGISSTTLFGAGETIVTAENLAQAYKNLEDLYKQGVVVPCYTKDNGANYTRFNWNSTARTWKDVYSSSYPVNTTVDGWISDAYVVDYTSENYSFKVKGMNVDIVGRAVAIDDITVNNVAAAAADFTATLSYNKYISETGAPTLNFYNANLPVVDKSNFVGSFSVTDKYDMPLVFDNAGIGNVGTTYNFSTVSAKRIDADGIETPISEITTANVQLVVYASEKITSGGATTTVKHYGIRVTPQTITGAKAGDKIVVTVTTNLKRPADNHAYNGEELSFEFVIAE